MRILAEVQNNLTGKDTSTNLIQQTPKGALPLVTAVASPKLAAAAVVYIHINGIGVGGIAVGFLFTICILIGVNIMMVIFVNTKTIDEPLRMGRIEH